MAKHSPITKIRQDISLCWSKRRGSPKNWRAKTTMKNMGFTPCDSDHHYWKPPFKALWLRLSPTVHISFLLTAGVHPSCTSEHPTDGIWRRWGNAWHLAHLRGKMGLTLPTFGLKTLTDVATSHKPWICGGPKVSLDISWIGRAISYLVGGAITILKNMSSSMGRMTWKIQNVWNHQPATLYTIV